MSLIIIELLIPYALLAYVIYKINKNLVFLLGIPFLMVMQDALLVGQVKLLDIPGR